MADYSVKPAGFMNEPGVTVAPCSSQQQPDDSSASLMSLPRRWILNKTKEGAISSTLNISTMNGALLNAVTTRKGIKSDLIIHTGQSTDSPPLAIARTHFISFKVSLPGLASQGEDREVSVKTKWWKLNPRVTFQMTGRDGQEYDFEWMSQAGRWRLMRRGAHGEDCVASWTFSMSSSRLSGEFEFEGAAATEQMGNAFPYVASISALAIGKMVRDSLFANAAIVVSN